jgi:hypothetical protein
MLYTSVLCCFYYFATPTNASYDDSQGKMSVRALGTTRLSWSRVVVWVLATMSAFWNIRGGRTVRYTHGVQLSGGGSLYSEQRGSRGLTYAMTEYFV